MNVPQNKKLKEMLGIILPEEEPKSKTTTPKEKPKSTMKSKKGNLLMSDSNVILHQVNCKGVMGAGIAKQIKEKYPEVYADYMNAYKNNELVLGNIIATATANNKIIISLCGQDTYGNTGVHTIYPALRECLNSTKQLLKESKDIARIGIPMGMGAGLAGGNWEKILTIIEEELVDMNVTIYEFTPSVNNYTWSRYGGYEVSSKGDKRFSAFTARLKDGRTIEEAYQLDIKGYRQYGNNPILGKGKPPIDKHIDTWEEYLTLWKTWAQENPELIEELRQKAKANNNTLSDMFANTNINQARALATILNETK